MPRHDDVGEGYVRQNIAACIHGFDCAAPFSFIVHNFCASFFFHFKLHFKLIFKFIFKFYEYKVCREKIMPSYIVGYYFSRNWNSSLTLLQVTLKPESSEEDVKA